MNQFVHLHNHTEFSLLDGAQPISRMLAKAAEHDMPAVAITDHGNLFGAYQFYKEAKRYGVKPIIGCEAYIAPGDRTDRRPNPGTGRGKPYHHLILLAQDKTGYQNLVQLVSRAYLEGFYYRPRMDKDLLRQYHRGLIALSGCLGAEIPTHLRHNRPDLAEAALQEYVEIFGQENFFLELQDQGLPVEKEVNKALVGLSEKYSIPLVATNDNHFLDREDQPAHDILICIGTGRTVQDESRMKYTWEHYFKTGDEMAQVFDWAPEALAQTVAIAERCELNLERTQYHVPRFDIPEGRSADEFLEETVLAGFQERLSDPGAIDASRLEEYEKRLQMELGVIKEMGFPGYFLIVWDLIRYARECNIPVGPGRGSAAGSLVAYALRITDIDPIRYDLLFERFLNPERISLPDIDIDFCMRRRGEVIDYVTRKYGRENVAQIITFGTLAARAVLRDAGRALGMSFGEVDRIAKLVPAELGTTLEKAMETVPKLADLYKSNPEVKRLVDVGKRLEGLSRHASTHAAGVVIAPRPLLEFVPLFKSSKDEVTTQWPMGDIEDIGLLKMDFLGLRTLTLIDDCCRLIREDLGETLDVDRLPLDDPKTYALFAKAQTSGIFQFESSGMRDILHKLKPERFEDLIALNALYRPGPIGSGMIDDFIDRRHGKVKVEHLHDMLEPLLRETYGVIVYQEQVMKIAAVMGGYSLGEADLLRRAMGKKKVAVMKAERKRFLQGAQARSVPPKIAGKVFELMEHFAGYGFNRSHSAAYALVAFRTAYLKAHHPVHFMAALLTTEKDTTDKLVQYINECREMDIQVLPPDINSSDMDFAVENGVIRFGLSAVKNVGQGAVESILRARHEVGSFSSLHQFCREVDTRQVNKRALESLIKAGAFDTIGLVRARLIKAVDQALDSARRYREEQETGQAALFEAPDEAADGVAPADLLPQAEPWTDRELLAYEKETLGFYITGHPLAEYRDILQEFSSRNTRNLESDVPDAEVTIGGIITALKPRKTRKGDWMAVFTLEDLEGVVETLVFPEAYKKLQELLADDLAVLIKGKVESDEGRCRLIVTHMIRLEEARQQQADALLIRMQAPDVGAEEARKLHAMLAEFPGHCPVYLRLDRPGAFALTLKTDPDLKVNPSAELTAAVEGLLGVGSVVFRVRGL
ncbi:MAG: DNA polymerase III subunit alpha [Acidobacteria bacterium]|nr:MAG: DNA polymerase III subunit alpha [Acidobacteriota bacterium]